MKKPPLKYALSILSTSIVLLGIFFFSYNKTPSPADDFFPPMPKYRHKKSICLNMIVKNESAVIKECLSSVKGFIDCWVIVDTGSTDGTQEIIKSSLKGIPGKLYERPWVDFAFNRNEALLLAKDKAEYSLIIDADETLTANPQLIFPNLDKDLYLIVIKQKDSLEYKKPFLINNALNWEWRGILHETLYSEQKPSYSILQGVSIASDTSLGNRSKNPNKYLDDAKVLEIALEKDPDNSRYQFYLAQCYCNAKEFCLALEHYQKRVLMEGDPEERFFSLLQIGKLQKALHMPPAFFIKTFMDAYAYRPTRLEPLYYLAAHYLSEKAYDKAYAILKKGGNPVYPIHDTLFVEGPLYQWDFLFKLSQAAYHLGKTKETLEIMQSLLQKQNLPEAVRAELIKNVSILSKKN